MELNEIWVVIPIGSREQYLPNVIAKLHKYHGRIVIVNNKPGYTKFDNVNHRNYLLKMIQNSLLIHHNAF